MKILIVEDDRFLALLAEGILSAKGHHCTIASTAQEAMDLWNKEHHPLILLDIHLGGLSGLDFCQWLRKQPLGKYSFVLVSTSDHNDQTFQKARASGVNDYLFKPLTPAALSMRMIFAQNIIQSLQTDKQTYQATTNTAPKLKTTAHPHLIHSLTIPISVSIYVPEIWTLCTTDSFEIPRNTKISIQHAFDQNHTVIETLDNDANPLQLSFTRLNQTEQSRGTRFIANNEQLDQSLGAPTTWITKPQPWRTNPAPH